MGGVGYNINKAYQLFEQIPKAYKSVRLHLTILKRPLLNTADDLPIPFIQ